VVLIEGGGGHAVAVHHQVALHWNELMTSLEPEE